MRCDVLLFAKLAEAVGADRVTIELSSGATVGDAIRQLSQEHKAIASMHDTLAVAVNESYCPHSATLAEGDTIALIPPVSGG